ncbi:MAG TPA: fatty acid desaturase CarF family protein [Ilumatobacteraceae bacterium]|nr:fatty acid desaturase CarF family protein [Ilumatobacteraceae bacterium]
MLGTYDYPTSHRLFELGCVAMFVGFAGALLRRVVVETSGRLSPPIVVLVVLVLLGAYAVADLASGVVHFLLDNFGSPDTPVIGQKFVKPFRDHHVDPMAMTKGDFVAVNGDNVFVCLPVVIPAFFFLDMERHLYAGLFIVGLVAGVIMTNQLHKWAHTPAVPRLVAAAQRRGIVLSKLHHSVHHSGEYDRNYCITWGRLDAVLNRLVLRKR